MRIAYCLNPEPVVGPVASWLYEHHRLVIATLRTHGHEVTVFGPANIVIEATVTVESAAKLIERVYSRSDSYDVIQWYAAEWPLDVARRCPTPTVITVTMPVPDREYYGDVTLVPVSGAVTRGAPHLPWSPTIPAAVDISRYEYSPVGGKSLIWIDDGSDSASARQVADRADVPLLRVPVDQITFTRRCLAKR